ncbi:MAG TPA: pyridoxal-dependent decarboxylase [Elusimicrobiota bacterium]|jgi:L-2,4-diaminobutyrate decarboxylase|nr:pyridoxal-dependent decarboxylase [Elusimicrobiota bacterium]
MDGEPEYLDAGNLEEVKERLQQVLSLALDFKTRERVSRHRPVGELLRKYVVPLPEKGCRIEELTGFIGEILGESINWSSPMFMGFNDAGNSVAGLMGGIVEATCQQNLINSDFCARAATFVEVATVRWLRELSGYPNAPAPRGVDELGGVATTGGTCSNMYGLLMARKNAYPAAVREGLPRGARPRVLVAADVTHYSVAAAAGLVGFGTDSLVKVPTRGFGFDMDALERALKECRDKGEDAVCVVANAGDSRTLTVEDLPRIAALVKELAPRCWLHVDACNGGQLLFSKRHRGRLRGIEDCDSIALDPHKVFNVPYASSYFLFKDPTLAAGFWTSSTLIMRDPWALGRLTPNIGTKSWSALKLFLLVKHLGTDRLGEIIDRRVDLAAAFRGRLSRDPRFRLVTEESDVNAVPFLFIGEPGPAGPEPRRVYELNERIYERMLEEGTFYVHGFPIKDDGGCLGRGRDAKLFVLRFMSGHPGAGEAELDRLIDRLARIGGEIEGGAGLREKLE